MKEALSIETERRDDLPLLLTHMQRMHLAELLDKHIPTHGQRKRLSVGELSVVWLAHLLSQASHRMKRGQECSLTDTFLRSIKHIQEQKVIFR